MQFTHVTNTSTHRVEWRFSWLQASITTGTWRRWCWNAKRMSIRRMKWDRLEKSHVVFFLLISSHRLCEIICKTMRTAIHVLCPLSVSTPLLAGGRVDCSDDCCSTRPLWDDPVLTRTRGSHQCCQQGYYWVEWCDDVDVPVSWAYSIRACRSDTVNIYECRLQRSKWSAWFVSSFIMPLTIAQKSFMSDSVQSQSTCWNASLTPDLWLSHVCSSWSRRFCSQPSMKTHPSWSRFYSPVELTLTHKRHRWRCLRSIFSRERGIDIHG